MGIACILISICVVTVFRSIQVGKNTALTHPVLHDRFIDSGMVGRVIGIADGHELIAEGDILKTLGIDGEHQAEIVDIGVQETNFTIVIGNACS